MGFLTKFNSDGEKLWTKLIGSSAADVVWGITTGLDGSIYLSGFSEGNLDGQTNNGNWDAFISKFSVNGEKQWTKLFGSANPDFAGWIVQGSDHSFNTLFVTEDWYLDGGSSGM